MNVYLKRCIKLVRIIFLTFISSFFLNLLPYSHSSNNISRISFLPINVSLISNASAQEVRLKPPSWRQLEFVASILFFSATANIEFKASNSDNYKPADLDAEFSKPLDAKAHAINQFVLSSNFLGKQSNISVFFEPNLNALQRSQIDSGKRNRFKLYQFLEEGVYSLRMSPRSGQKQLPRTQWTDKGEDHFIYPAKLKLAQPILDATSLFYIMSSGLFNKPGDRASFVVFVKNRLLRMNFTAKEWVDLELEYFQQKGKNKEYISGEQEVLRVVLKAVPLVAAKVEEFEFLGLKGDLEFYIDTEKRLLVQLSGGVDIVGTVDIVLNKVVMN